MSRLLPATNLYLEIANSEIIPESVPSAWLASYKSIDFSPAMFAGSGRLALEAASLGALQGWRPLSFNRTFTSTKWVLSNNPSEETLITDEFSTIKTKYSAPHYPIVLCHGFSGFDKLNLIPGIHAPADEAENRDSVKRGLLQVDYWYGIEEALTKLGAKVLTAKVPAFGTIEERAKVLHDFLEVQARQLRQQSKADVYHPTESHAGHSKSDTFKGRESPESNPDADLVKLNLVSHSMGGLDSRYLIFKLRTDPTIKRSYRVATLTTISTPHHGSECADFIVDSVGDNQALRTVVPPSVFEMTTEGMKKFNAEIVDDPEVQYFSYGARFHPKWYNVFNLTYHVMTHQIKRNCKAHNSAEGLENDIKNYLLENDGVVSVASAHWGTYLGTLDNVDHLDLINWTNRARNAADKLIFNQQPKFNAIALYLNLADALSKRGY